MGSAIATINPNIGRQGQTNMNVAIKGQSTSFVAGTSVVSFGPGISVGAVAVTDETNLTAQISIDEAAAVGSRTVTVTSGSEIVSLTNGFSVTPGAPAIIAVHPNEGPRGQTGLVVAITGQFTDFGAGLPVVSFGSGVTVGTVTVINGTHLTAQISIDAAAALGGRTVTVMTGAEVASLTNAFVVTQAANPAVRLNPFGTRDISEGPFNLEVVDDALALVPAPQNITVTLLREVISACRGVLFSSQRTIVVSQGQSLAGGIDAAGRDPSCNTLPITTEWTVLGAVMDPGVTLDLGMVPGQQRFVAIRR
jgi:hypothetical protein